MKSKFIADAAGNQMMKENIFSFQAVENYRARKHYEEEAIQVVKPFDHDELPKKRFANKNDCNSRGHCSDDSPANLHAIEKRLRRVTCW